MAKFMTVPQTSIAIVGGSGYIGSVLSRVALRKGFLVTVFDLFFFGHNIEPHKNLTLIKIDSRDITKDDLKGFDIVFDLAAISNDPAGEINTELTMDINFLGRKNVQQASVQAKVARYVLASSCSVYGFQSKLCDEQTEPNPLTAYAEANVLAEKSTLELGGSGTTFVCARQATVFGLSSRMRFDLAVNGMTRKLFETGRLALQRDGEQSRPLVHVWDLANGLLELSRHPFEEDHTLINVGFNELNMKIRDIGERVISEIDRSANFEWYGDADHRSYEVDFSKFESVVWRGSSPLQVEKGAREIYGALSAGIVDTSTKSMTLEWYQQEHADFFSEKGMQRG